MSRRAVAKKMRRKISVGDLVIWGRCVAEARVVEVAADGVYVDTVLEDGSVAPRHFVTWEGGGRGRGPGVSPLVLVKKG